MWNVATGRAICPTSKRRLGRALGRQIAAAGRSSARAEPMGVAITIAVLCLWQPQPRPPRAASRRRAPTPLLCTDASSDWRRRDLLRAAAVSVLTAGGLSVGRLGFGVLVRCTLLCRARAKGWVPAGQPVALLLIAHGCPHGVRSRLAGEAAPLHAHQAPHRPAQHATLAAAAVERREAELCGPCVLYRDRRGSFGD